MFGITKKINFIKITLKNDKLDLFYDPCITSLDKPYIDIIKTAIDRVIECNHLDSLSRKSEYVLLSVVESSNGLETFSENAGRSLSDQNRSLLIAFLESIKKELK